MMKLKVTVALDEKHSFHLTDHAGCEALNPKELLLYSAALCAGMTLQYVLKKDNLKVETLEISVEGELSTPELRAESLFTSFEVTYRVTCRQMEEQAEIARAVRLSHDEMCGLVKMLRRIAPVKQEISVVSVG